MASQNQIVIPALGRPFDLGMLYDRRSDNLVLGKTLWSPDYLNAARNVVPQPYTNAEVFTENSIEDKASALKIEASLKLSFLSGLVNVEGSAKYLNDTKTSTRQSRVVLKYETTTQLKQLTMNHLGTGNIQYPEVFDQVIATDVVVGILYGAKAFMIFDKEVSKNESLKDVHGNMTVLVKSLPGISVDGHGSVKITEEQKKNTENMHCKMYGDFRTNESPTNYEDAVKVYKQLPSLIGEKGENAVPIQIYLCPLSNIDSKCQRIVREISAGLVSKTVEIQEHLQTVVAECNDLKKEEVCFFFPRLTRQLSSFMKSVELYKVFFQKKLLSALPKIRGGGAEEIELATIIQKKETSPFSGKVVECWLKDKKKEIMRIQGVIRSLKDTSVVKPETVENELYDPENQYIVCCTFKIAYEEDDQISKMDAYINNGEESNNTITTNTSLEVDEKSTYKKVREALKHFITLKSTNKDNDSVQFLSTDEPLTPADQSNSGAFLILYEDGEIENKDIRSYPKPNNCRVNEAGHNTLELCLNGSGGGSNFENYRVEYKEESSVDSWSSVIVTSCNESQQTVTLTELQPATKYVIRICAFRKIIVSEYSDVISATTKPTSPPGKPQLVKASSDAITIKFANPQHIGEEVKINNYKVEWSNDGNWTSSNVQHTVDAKPTFTLKHHGAVTSYVFKITANCGEARESNASPNSEAISTSLPLLLFQPEKILGLCNIVQPSEDNKPAVYSLPLRKVFDDPSLQLRKYEIYLDSQENSAQVSSTPNKVIMMVGFTGSGKTTTVNAMINHILGVNWKDNFRFKMIHEDSSNQGTENIGNQTFSQTQYVTCYTLHHLEGFKIPYTLTIVDTPGFDGSRGIKQDEKITDQIRNFFNTSGINGIDHIDAICFVTQAGNPRLTHTQRCVFDRILSMFGKDIKENISVLFTFADGQKPQAMDGLREAGIVDKDVPYFKFNNHALFVGNSEKNDDDDDDDNFDRMFWSMGIKSFEKFFESLNVMESRSLVLTKEVLEERAQLEVIVSGLQEKINRGINTLSRLQQEKRIFNQHAIDINDNMNFKYTVTEERRVSCSLPSGTYAFNCRSCNYTCRYPCTGAEGIVFALLGSCNKCPDKCYFKHHAFDQHRMYSENIQVEREYDGKKIKFMKAKEGQSKVEAIINHLQAEFNETEDVVIMFVAEMQHGLQRLSEIALKKDPLQQVDYLDLLIESEKAQARPGFKERIQSLQAIRSRAEPINQMAKPGYDPWKDYRENEETRQFLQRH